MAAQTFIRWAHLKVWEQMVGLNLLDALTHILGEARRDALLGEDLGGLTGALEQAAIRCFREKREDGVATIVRDSLALLDKGELELGFSRLSESKALQAAGRRAWTDQMREI